MAAFFPFPTVGRGATPAIAATALAMFTDRFSTSFGRVSSPIPWSAAAPRFDVAREMGIEAHGLDLHSGFNILKQEILETVGKPSDLVLSHPPYHNIVIYSGEVWGRVGHPDDLSRCATEDEFVGKLTIAVRNQRHATKPGGYYGAIIGDVRRGGVYSSYQADLITRMPKTELRAVLIKQQHNVASGSRDYPMKLPRIMHEYVVLWQRPGTVAVARPRDGFAPG